jgi:polysaccharide export outer membrane protein
MNRIALVVLLTIWALQRPYCAGQVSPGAPVGSPPVSPSAAPVQAATSDQTAIRSDYVLGADDMVTIQVADVPFTDQTPMRIETSGHLKLPMVGRVMAGGLTPAQLEDRIADALKTYVRKPQVMVRLVEFRSQPVTVLGAVTTPGIHQLRGRKTLLEIISLAGGLRQDAGTIATITRGKAFGTIPLSHAHADASGEYTSCEVNLRELMEARAPQNNILIQPTDVIAVEKAPVVYVIGAVKKSGGFVLNAQEKVSVLQALAMAEGLDRASAAGNAKVLRKSNDPDNRQELAVDLKKIMSGKSADVLMQPEDILFIPTSTAKNAGLRGLETAINIGTGVMIFRR